MADMSGEDAFLASMNAAEYDPTSYDPADQTAIEGQEEEEEDDEDYDPSSFMPDQPQPSATPQPAAVQSQPPSQIASRTASPKSETTATQKPKTIGGFIEEDDDEDEEEQEHGTGTNGSLAQTPVLQQQQNVQAVYNPPPTDLLEQDHAPSAIPTRGAPVQGQALPQSSAPVPSAQISSSSAALSKPRLPQDRVGQLEDRIADDPKGDVDAWLDLIALHRSKNKLDDARNVYDRFFEVFPTAVSSTFCILLSLSETVSANESPGRTMGRIRPHGARPGRLPSLGEHLQHGSPQELQRAALGHLPRLHQTSQQCHDRRDRPSSPDYHSGVRLRA